MEKEVLQKLEEFFGRTIEAERFATHLRRFMYESIRMVLETDEERLHKDWITDGHYWISELCEILDPQLEKDL